MKSSLEYNFRVRSNSDVIAFKIAEHEPFTHVPFSLPPTYAGEEFKIIERPKIPELDNFVERYLEEQVKEKETEKNIKTLIKKFIKKKF